MAPRLPIRSNPGIFSTILLIGGISFLLSRPLEAATPQEEVQSTVAKVLTILRGERDEKTDKQLRAVISQRFDFREMAKRSLGSHWRSLKSDEQQEFGRLFTDLLADTYIDRIEEYSNEKIIFTGERRDGDYATVESRIVPRDAQEFSIDYKLHLISGEWRVYDVVIENISLVNNYRSQFNRVILNSSYEELLRRMKAKLDKP